MAGYRQIHTKIWKDEWFIELPPNEKLLFIYLFSNESAEICGLYKLPQKVMANETGIDLADIRRILAKFEDVQKVVYRDGVVWVVHMSRYHANASPKTQARVSKSVEMIGDCEIKTWYLYYQKTGIYCTDTLSIPDSIIKSLNKIESKSLSGSISESEPDPTRESAAAQIYSGIVGGMGLPASERGAIISATNALLGKFQTIEGVIHYARPFYEKFKESKPRNPNRAYWYTDWAVVGKMPEVVPRANGNGQTPAGARSSEMESLAEAARKFSEKKARENG